MVASRHPSSRSTGRRPASPCPRSPGPSVGVDENRRPQLRLVVDNTSHIPVSARPASHSLTPVAGEYDPISVELGAWVAASVRLAEARWRLARQRLVNRFGQLGLADRVGDLAPIIALGALVVFGALFTLRLAQESASPESGRTVVSVSGAATATSSATGASAADRTGGLESAVVVVHPGDSLWSIATSRFSQHDPRRVVDAFVEVNGASAIVSGQQLVVPDSLIEG